MEAREGELEARGEGAEGNETKKRKDMESQIGNGVALAPWECTVATQLPTRSAVPQLARQRTAIRVWTHLAPSRRTPVVGDATLERAEVKTGSRTPLRLDVAPTKWMALAGGENRASTGVGDVGVLCRMVLKQSAQLPQLAVWAVRQALWKPDPPKWRGRLPTSHAAALRD